MTKTQLQEAHEAIWAMAEDGWLYHGVEGMAPAQQLVSDYTLKYPKETADEPSVDLLGEQIYSLLVRRGYAQHEAHAIANGPGCTHNCVQNGFQDIDCPEHGKRAR